MMLDYYIFSSIIFYGGSTLLEHQISSDKLSAYDGIHQELLVDMFMTHCALVRACPTVQDKRRVKDILEVFIIRLNDDDDYLEVLELNDKPSRAQIIFEKMLREDIVNLNIRNIAVVVKDLVEYIPRKVVVIGEDVHKETNIAPIRRFLKFVGGKFQKASAPSLP